MRPFYALLHDLPGFVLLESADHQHGRYDIVSAYPYEQVEINQNDDLEEALERLNQTLPPQPSCCDLPFQGGAIGFVSYDLGAKRCGLVSDPLPGLEDMPLSHLGFYDWAIITDHHLKQVYLFSANTQAQTADLVREVMVLWQRAESVAVRFELKTSFQPLISQERYQEAFYLIMADIRKGRSYQVNYTQPFMLEYEGSSWAIYDLVASKNPVPFSAYLCLDADSSVLSFSPERYILMEDECLLSSPIKGTVKRSSNRQEDEALKVQLQQCSKNRAENVMIVDLLRNDLGRISRPGSVKVSSLCEVQSFNGVHHLVSDIESQALPSYSPFEAFLSCFPGGSITGAPKLEAMQVIAEHEGYSRGVYCGAIAYFSRHGRFDSNIAIRTVTAKNKRLYMAAGGGLVIDSDCDDEYAECYTKISAIVKALSS